MMGQTRGKWILKASTWDFPKSLGADLFVLLVIRHAPAALGLRVEALARQGKGFPPNFSDAPALLLQSFHV